MSRNQHQSSTKGEGNVEQTNEQTVFEEEKKKLYQRWGINPNSKRRKLQLIHRLWSNTEDPSHVQDSASIVAKLIRFSEQGQALKEMFGLSFSPPKMVRRSLGWLPSKSSLM